MAVKKKRKKRAAAKAVIAGRRVGTKRQDTRWEAPNGAVWASRFEYSIWEWLRANRAAHSRIDPITYTSAVKHGRCEHCDSNDVVQVRRYTPDFLVYSPSQPHSISHSYYIEAKGYLRAEKRRLLRSFRACRPTLDLRLLVERDYKVTDKLTITQWAERYLKCPVAVWNGKLPEGW